MTQYTKEFIIRQRFLTIKKYQQGMKVTQLCKELEVSRKTFYKWLDRYLSFGKEGLLDRSRRPKRPHPNSLKPKAIKAILRVRKRTNYGPRRIKIELLKRGIKVSEYAIYKTLVREELISKHKKHKKKGRKYYAPYPGHTVQIDTKYLDIIPGYPARFYQYTAIDCYTRMRVLRVYDELSAYNMEQFLKQVVKQLPFRVETVRTDNGLEFTYGPFKKDHPFFLECVRNNIKHRLNKPAHPEANGRVERSHRTDEEEFYRVTPVKIPHQWIDKVRRWEYRYNYLRPHSSLGNLTPYQYWKKYEKEHKKKVTENVT